MESLQDQLLKAGLASKEQAKDAQRERRERRRSKNRRKGGKAAKSDTTADQAARQAQQAQAEKRRRDRELNRQREAAKAAKSGRAAVQQMIRRVRVDDNRGEVAFHFAVGKVIKRILVTEHQARSLAEGRLAVVALDREYALVPRETGEKVREQYPQALVLLNEPGGEDDAAYAEHPIPDDLMW